MQDPYPPGGGGQTSGDSEEEPLKDYSAAKEIDSVFVAPEMRTTMERRSQGGQEHF